MTKSTCDTETLCQHSVVKFMDTVCIYVCQGVLNLHNCILKWYVNDNELDDVTFGGCSLIRQVGAILMIALYC